MFLWKINFFFGLPQSNSSPHLLINQQEGHFQIGVKFDARAKPFDWLFVPTGACNCDINTVYKKKVQVIVVGYTWHRSW